MVRQATETAVSASISTPVGPVTFTLARTRQPGRFASGSISAVTFDSARGWQSGIRSAVRLAAMMPAMRAVPSTSPFLALPDTIRSSVALVMTTRPSATASRSLAGLSDTSTIRASPEAPIWVSAGPVLVLDWFLDWFLDRVLAGFVAVGLLAMSARARRARRLARQQGARRSGNVGLPHQALADQEGRHADALEPGEIGGREDAALADHQPVLRNKRRQCFAGRKRGFEGAQIAIVDADHRRTQLQCAIKLGAVVDLDQHVHAMGDGGVLELFCRGFIERRHDDQDAVGAVRAGLRHLVSVEHEILAQHRQ